MAQTTQRSIKVKISKKNENYEKLKNDLWFTHEYFHQGVQYYQEMVLMLRQGDVHLNYNEAAKKFKLSPLWAKLYPDNKDLFEVKINGNPNLVRDLNDVGTIKIFGSFWQNILKKLINVNEDKKVAEFLNWLSNNLSAKDENAGYINKILEQEGIGKGEPKGVLNYFAPEGESSDTRSATWVVEIGEFILRIEDEEKIKFLKLHQEEVKIKDLEKKDNCFSILDEIGNNEKQILKDILKVLKVESIIDAKKLGKGCLVGVITDFIKDCRVPFDILKRNNVKYKLGKTACLSFYKENRNRLKGVISNNDKIEGKIEFESKISEFRRSKLLPIFKQVREAYPERFDKGMAPWEYAMWVLAVQTLRSWNTWDIKTREHRDELDKKIKDYVENLQNNKVINETIVKLLEKYENQQTKNFRKLQPDSRNYRITTRDTRKWEVVEREWNKKQCVSELDRIDAVKKLQSEYVMDFGSANLFIEMAQDKYESIWKHDQGEKTLVRWSSLNQIKRELDKNKGYARCTLTNAITHPVWGRFENHNGSGSNAPGYQIEVDENNNWKLVNLKLLHQDVKGLKIQAYSNIIIDKSVQTEQYSKNKDKWVFCDNGTKKKISDVLPKGAKLQLNRAKLSQKEYKAGFYFNMSWEIPVIESKWIKQMQKAGGEEEQYLGWFYSNNEAKNVFNSPRPTIKNHDSLFPSDKPLRIMSVDMGQRSLGACSIFEITKDKTAMELPKLGVLSAGKLMHKDIKKTKFKESYYAKHERSFLLQLPGENPSSLIEKARMILKYGLEKGSELGDKMLGIGRFDTDKIDEKAKGDGHHFVPIKKIMGLQKIKSAVKLLKNIRGLIRLANKEVIEKGYKRLLKEKQNLITNEIEKRIEVRQSTFERICSYYEKHWPLISSKVQLKKELINWDKDGDLWVTAVKKVVQNEYEKLDSLFKKWRKQSLKPRQLLILDEKGNKKTELGLSGLSMWGIDYLQEVRSLLLQWHTFSPDGEQRSLARGANFATHLLDHINNIKDDRLKKGADAFIMSALGYIWVATDGLNRIKIIRKDKNSLESLDEGLFIVEYEKQKKALKEAKNSNNKKLLKEIIRKKIIFYATGVGNPKAKQGKWLKLYDACHLIVFEDLSRYTFDMSRTKYENNKLMQWAHRALPREVALQGELHQVFVGVAQSDYTSRYHATTLTPGVRGNAVPLYLLKQWKLDFEKDINSKEMLSYSWSWIEREVYKLFANKRTKKMNVNSFKEYNHLISGLEERTKNLKGNYGVLLPIVGGEIFITLKQIEKSNKGYKELTYRKNDSFSDMNVSYLQADINAAQNIGRRWLSRYAEPYKISASYSNEYNCFIPKMGARVKRVLPIGILKLSEDFSNKDFSKEEVYLNKWFSTSYQYLQKEENTLIKLVENKSIKNNKDKSSIVDIEVQKALESLSNNLSFFRDPSGLFYPKDTWVTAKKFWSEIPRIITKKLCLNPILLKIKKETIYE